jgi:Tfp pilus assembly protein PilX
MKAIVLFKQQGAVLAFSLVMLLLLTLVGVSMIQQNKQQLMMAGNMRQQNQVFASVESELSSAEPYIDRQRYVNANIAGLCKAPTAEFDDPNYVLPLNINNVTSKVTETYCFTSGGNVLRCNHTTDDPLSMGCDKWDNTRSSSCTGEIYTIETTANDASGTQRKIESKYAIDCSGGYLP